MGFGKRERVTFVCRPWNALAGWDSGLRTNEKVFLGLHGLQSKLLRNLEQRGKLPICAGSKP
jgi:hypothetical protein